MVMAFRRALVPVTTTLLVVILPLLATPAGSAGPAPAGSSAMVAGFDCVPSVEGPVAVTTTSQPFRPFLLPSLPRKWIDQEFFVACSSSRITYKTAVWVRRPLNPRRTSGIVVVDPLHSLGILGVLTNVQPYLARHGDVHVGVAANSVALGLVKAANPTRYASLHVPTTTPDAENEILAGVGALLRRHPGPLAPGAHVRLAILGGWSATAVEVRGFISSPGGTATVGGHRVYDGYFPAQAAVGSAPGPIPDVGVPVVEIQGERELLETLRRFGRLGYRRDDSATYRLYEVPGLAHVSSEPDNPASIFSRSLPCDWPAGAVPSAFRQTHVWQMGLDNLVRWIARDIPPPRAQRILLEHDGSTVVRDRNGNASGGVRTTVLDVATATVVPTSLNPGGVPGNPCAYVGYQLNFSRDLLERRYHSHGGYVRRVVRVARSLVRHHWLLPADARNEVVTAVRSDVLR
jgi:hypothetical protein